MSRTSMALKRLGVASLAVVTMGAVLPAITATNAQAASAATVSITPEENSGASNTCVTFTLNVADAAGNAPTDTTTVNVILTDPDASETNTATGFEANSTSFCTVDQNGNLTSSNSGQGIQGTDQTQNQRQQEFLIGPGQRTVTFGVFDTEAETVAIRAFIDQGSGTGTNNNNDRFDAGEPSDTARAVFTAGGGNANTANDAVRNITEVPRTNDAPVTAGDNVGQRIDVRLTNAAGNPVANAVPSFVVNNGGANSTGTTNNTTSPRGNCTASNNNGISTCTVQTANAGTDTITIFVNQTSGATSGPDAGEPQLTVTRTTNPAPNTNVSQARNIDLTPEGPADAASGTDRRFTATVTDASGRAVQGVDVDFFLQGIGFFTNPQPANTLTNSLGQVTIDLRTAQGQTGQATVTATIASAGTQCTAQAGQGGAPATSSSTAGNCSDSEVTNFSPAQSPSPSVSPSASASPSPSNTASPAPTSTTSPSGPPQTPCTVPASITLDRDTIIATGSAQITVRATPNSVVQVFAYSRPSTTFRVVRNIEIGGDGVATDRIVPPTNTRLYAQQQGCNASRSIVLNVRTVISLAVVRNGTRNYTFSGRALPARAGGLIVSLYRVTNDGRQILTAQTRADASTGRYTINRQFTGTGRFGFVVRTGQDLQNAPGSSNVRSLLVF